MSMSNIPVNEEINKKYNEMQIKKNYGYLLMSINKEENEVVLEKAGDPFPKHCTPSENEEVFNEVRKGLLENELEPKYLLFDFRIVTKDGRKPEKLVFITWCSDNCPIKKKTLQGSTTENLKKLFHGLGATIQANDADELEYNNIVKELLSGKQ